MFKMVYVHISGPKMNGMQRDMLELRPGGIEGYRDNLTKRTEAQLVELNTLLQQGYEKFDAQVADFADGQAIVYVLYKPEPPKYIVEQCSLDVPLGERAWKQLGDPFETYQEALLEMKRLPGTDYMYQIKAVDHA